MTTVKGSTQLDWLPYHSHVEFPLNVASTLPGIVVPQKALIQDKDSSQNLMQSIVFINPMRPKTWGLQLAPNSLRQILQGNIDYDLPKGFCYHSSDLSYEGTPKIFFEWPGYPENLSRLLIRFRKVRTVVDFAMELVELLEVYFEKCKHVRPRVEAQDWCILKYKIEDLYLVELRNIGRDCWQPVLCWSPP